MLADSTERSWRLVALVLCLGACGQPEIIVGGGRASEGGGVGRSATSVPASDSPPVAQPNQIIEGLTRDSPWLGRWQGPMPGLGSLLLDLRYPQQAEGAVGFTVFGEGDAPAPALDPRRGYPVPADMRHQPGLYHHAVPASGFVYSVLSGVFDQRLRLSISYNQLWANWCGEQPATYYHSGSGRYSCAPEEQLVGPDGQCLGPGGEEPVDCDQRELCNSFEVCVCWLNGCSADLSHVVELALDLSDDGMRIGGILLPDQLPITLTREY